MDFKLVRATRLHGRVTIGKANRPAAKTYLEVVIDKGHIPVELRRKGDRAYHPVQLRFGTQTDKDGHFEFHLGPGEYQIQNLRARIKPVKVTISADNPPTEIVQNFHMPRAELGLLAGRVLDSAGKPVAEAVVEGQYTVQNGYWFALVKTDAQGRFQVKRSLDPLVLHAHSADKTRAGVVRITAEATKTEIVIGPAASASGRLLDLQGKPLAEKKVLYGIRVYLGDPERGHSTDRFGGRVTTDTAGHFTITGLVLGETYHLRIQPDEHSFRPVKEVKADKPEKLVLGDLRVDPKPFQPYVPPTPQKRSADAFAAKKQTAPRKRIDHLLAEARLVYTRPLLLFGRPKDPACIDLFRLFNENTTKAENEHRLPTANELRWDFELASLDTDRAEVRRFAQELGIVAGKENAPVLAVLHESGKLMATYTLRLGDKQKLDGAAVAAFLRKHKLATRDAEKMLAEALQRAKKENKRTFLIASASWCGPCRRLARFLAKWKDELERHYVFVKLDISRDKHADEVRKRFQNGKHEGVPWYAILDADGKVIITSNATGTKPRVGSTNIGFPSEAKGIEHFVKMLKQTAPRMSEEQRKALRAALTE